MHETVTVHVLCDADKNGWHLLNHWPRFIHSLCHFQGATRKIKPCCWRKWRSSYCEGYKVYGACV